MPDKVGQQIGNYRLIQLLGSGGFADVYLGQHVHVQRLQAAVKLLHANLAMVYQGGFLQEAENIAGMKHPHIIRILDFGIDRDNAPYLIMEYASHGTLRICHPKGSMVPSRMVVFYVKQITEALQYAHDHNLIHRDLKPENLLIGENDEILLSDFGIASVAQGTASTASLETGTYAGTIPYSAPEQIQGKPRRASDQYSLGIIVYEWLSGERPFTGTMMEIISQQLAVAPSPLHEKVPNIPTEVESVVMTALAKDPRQRFASVLAFANALEQACLPSHQPPPAEEFIPNQGPPAGTLTIQDTPQEEVVSQQPEQSVPVKLVSDSEEIAALPATEPVLQQLPHSVPVEEARKGDDKKKEHVKVEQVSSHQPTAMPSGRTWQRSWDGINRFFGKYRIIAWICFMVLSAILGIWGGQIVHSYSCWDINSCFDPIESVFLFGDVGIGAALIGLALLLANGRAIGDIIGGIAFTLLGDILLFYSSHLFYGSTLAYNVIPWPGLAPSYGTFLFMLECASISTLLLLLLGVRFFVRSANTILESVVGALMIIVGTVLLIYTLPFVQTNYANLPNLLSWLWILQILLGIVVIIFQLRKGRRNKQSAQQHSQVSIS